VSENRYGYFKYADVSFGAKETANYTADFELQNGSTLTQLSVGVKPYDYASFEQGEYNTENPKKIYKSGEKLGLLSSVISDDEGVFENPLKLTSIFDNYHTMTGVTLNSRNLVLEIEIIGYRDDEEITRFTASAENKNNFFEFAMELVNKVDIIVKKIAEPYHFFGIFDIEYGAVRIFDDTTNSSAEIKEYYSVYGDSLEYNTLDLSIVNFENKDFFFQRKQSVEYIVDDAVKTRFFIESGNELDEVQISFVAYDNISNLEDTFYGGIYTNYSLPQLINDIFENKEIDYEIDERLNDVVVNGYLPVSTRRKTLQTVLQGTNTRCLKKEKLYFVPVDLTVKDLILDESNVLSNPIKTKKQEISSMILTTHNYSKGNQETELYHWFLSTSENTKIVFNAPAHKLKAYEVTGVDSDGNETISTTVSKNVEFIETHPNYCIVKSKTTKKIVINGLTYTDNAVEYKKNNNFLLLNNNYAEKKVDLTLISNPQSVCDMLYDLYSRKNSIVFKSFEDLEVGGYYNILGENLNIKSKYHDLNGIYEYEAV
jgi:hypothetical protein